MKVLPRVKASREGGSPTRVASRHEVRTPMDARAVRQGSRESDRARGCSLGGERHDDQNDQELLSSLPCKLACPIGSSWNCCSWVSKHQLARLSVDRRWSYSRGSVHVAKSRAATPPPAPVSRAGEESRSRPSFNPPVPVSRAGSSPQLPVVQPASAPVSRAGEDSGVAAVQPARYPCPGRGGLRSRSLSAPDRRWCPSRRVFVRINPVFGDIHS